MTTKQELKLCEACQDVAGPERYCADCKQIEMDLESRYASSESAGSSIYEGQLRHRAGIEPMAETPSMRAFRAAPAWLVLVAMLTVSGGVYGVCCVLIRALVQLGLWSSAGPR